MVKSRIDNTNILFLIEGENIKRHRLNFLTISLTLVIGAIVALFAFNPVNVRGLATLAFHQIVPGSPDTIYTIRLPIVRNPTSSTPPNGPLRVNPANPRYFTDGSGKAILLVGSDYWNLWQDGGRNNPPPAFDFDAFIQFALDHGYNYIKSQTWEQARHMTDGQYWYTTTHDLDKDGSWNRPGRRTKI